MQKVSIYLETSIKGFNKTLGWYGYIVEYIDSQGGKHIRDSYQCAEGVTPNMITLMAFCDALDRLTRDCRITVYTDSDYLRESCMNRLNRWKENGWMTAHRESVRNKALWQRAAEKMSGHIITFGTEEDHAYKDQMKEELRKRRMGYAV